MSRAVLAVVTYGSHSPAALAQAAAVARARAAFSRTPPGNGQGMTCSIRSISRRQEIGVERPTKRGSKPMRS